MNCCAFFLCLLDDLLWSLTFFSCHASKFFNFSHTPFVDCNFFISTFHSMEQKNELVRKIIMTQRIGPPSSSVIFTNSLFWDSLSCAFSKTFGIHKCMHTSFSSLWCWLCEGFLSAGARRNLSRSGLYPPLRLYSLRSFGIAESTITSNFLRAFFLNFFNFHVFRIKMPGFGLSMTQCRFSFC